MTEEHNEHLALAWGRLLNLWQRSDLGGMPAEHVDEPSVCVDAVVHNVENLITEHADMAGEIIRLYEQLNLVFDAASNAAGQRDIPSLLDWLLSCGLEVFHAEQAVMISHSDTIEGRILQCSGSDISTGSRGDYEAICRELQGIADESRQCGRVVVAGDSEMLGAEIDYRRPVIAGLITIEDTPEAVVMIARKTGDQEFDSGDVLLLESLLSFSSHIASNIRLFEKLNRMGLQIVRAMVNAIDAKDHYTSGHSERVGVFAVRLAQKVGLPDEQVRNIEWGAVLHDIGKLGIMDKVLGKEGKLDPEELALIRKHPKMGYDILAPIAQFKYVLDGVVYHHENYDGSGYPEGLAGKDIPIAGMIVHFADVFDALISDRSYRKGFSVEKALEIMRSQIGTLLDPDVSVAFFELLDEWQQDDASGFDQLIQSARSTTVSEEADNA